MKLHDCAQGSVDWLIARAGIPTASEFHSLVTPKFEIRKGEMPKSYLARKLAEKWLGGPLAGFTSFDTDQGRILEEEAIPWFELDSGILVQRPGFITTDDGAAGCSPDAWIQEYRQGLEIKCPSPETHVKYLLAGEVPDDYLAQVHGSMFVTEAKSWRFVSYRRRFPALVIEVARDERIQTIFALCIAAFNERLNQAYDRLCELNGGPPPRPRFKTEPQPYVADQNDVPIP